MELVDKSIKLKEDWENLWTKAQLLAAAGNTKAALPLAQRAQTLGKTSKNFFYSDEIAKAINDWKK